MITRHKDCTLHVFGTSEWPHVGLHGALWLAETWKSNGTNPQTGFSPYDHSLAHRYNPPSPGSPSVRPPRLEHAATIVGFSATNFYHFVLGALPRLVMLLPTLKRGAPLKGGDRTASGGGGGEGEAADRRKPVRLIVPATAAAAGAKKQSGAFVDAFLSRILPADLWSSQAGGGAGGHDGENPVERLARWRREKLVVPYLTSSDEPGARLAVKHLYWADWPRVAFGGKHRHRGVKTHCLTPPLALGATRTALQAAFAAESDPASESKVVVYATREGASMRQLQDEETLLRALRQAVEDSTAGGGGGGGRVVVFDGGKMPTSEAVALFQQAAAVVGVHGAGLSNILVSRPGTLLVELGFRAPATAHYEHAALALGLQYAKVPLAADQYSVAGKVVAAGEGGFEQVVEAVKRHLASLPLGGGGRGHEEL